MKRHRNTPKSRQLRPKNGAVNLVNLLYKLKAEIIMDDEKYFCLNVDNMPGSARYTRMTNQNVQTMFALLEKINILKKY